MNCAFHRVFSILLFLIQKRKKKQKEIPHDKIVYLNENCDKQFKKKKGRNKERKKLLIIEFKNTAFIKYAHDRHASMYVC